MSIHNDPRRFSTDDDEYREWQNDLRTEYARETYEEKYLYEDTEYTTCDYRGEDGSCNCDESCIHQCGKWKDMCVLVVKDEVV